MNDSDRMRRQAFRRSRRIRIFVLSSVLAVSLLVCFGQAEATAAPAPPPATHSGSAAGPSITPAAPAAPTVVLYDQYDNQADAAPTEILSQDYEAAYDTFDSLAADDFVVPSGQSWSISGVDVDGGYQFGGPAFSVNVYFYANGAGDLPGPLVASRPGSSFTDTAGNFAISLSPAVVLAAGSYWVSVQARQDFDCCGQWYWRNRTLQYNQGSAWQNPSNGWNYGCTTWTRKTSCSGLGDPYPDQVFRLTGTFTPNVVLYDQYDNDANNGVTSMKRADDPSHNAEAADDFVVPVGKQWSITHVDVRSYPGYPAEASFNVAFYTNDGALPGAQIGSYSSQGYSGTNPDYVITLSSPMMLSSGTYWISIQANMSVGIWYWGERAVQSGSPAAWREAGGWGTGCTSWSNRGTCMGNSSLPDQIFRLWGASSTPTAVTLTSFAARAGGSGVSVSWRTVGEAQVLGFNVWRRGAASRHWLKLNARLIRARGAGSSYRYLDRSVRPGARYLYRLETVKLDGSASWTAPLSISVGAM